MPDRSLEAWAKLLVGYSTQVEPGQVVAVAGHVAGEPLLRAVHRQVLAAGGHPVLLPTFSGLNAVLLANGSDDQLRFVSPLERFAREQADALITVWVESNTKGLSGADPARQAVWQGARAEVMRAFMRRSAAGELRWVLTTYPTDAHAQDAEMATADFAAFVAAACKLDDPDPAAAWRAQAAEQQRLVDRLAGTREVRLVGPDTDLTLSVAGRTWVNADGRHNLPDGEVFTGPVEASAAGHVRFSYPAILDGREVADVRLRFRDGRVVDASAARNEAYLHRLLDTDPGARVVGEFAFGTNFGVTRFTRDIAFDEKIGGTVHLALGAGYPETGSRNESAVHTDLVCDLRQGGRVELDGQPVLVDGRFVV